MMRVKVTGDRELTRKLKQLGDARFVQGMLEKALVAGALVVANEAKDKAPVRTGNLRRSIHVGGHTSETPDFANSKGGDLGKVSLPNKVRVLVGTDLIYARIQEYGGTIEAKHAPYLRFQIDGHWVTVKSVQIPARPYLRPALDTKSAAAIRDIGKAIKDQLERRARQP